MRSVMRPVKRGVQRSVRRDDGGGLPPGETFARVLQHGGYRLMQNGTDKRVTK